MFSAYFPENVLKSIYSGIVLWCKLYSNEYNNMFLFQDPSVESSQSFSVMPRQCGLASLQLVTMELKTVVRSNDAVEVHATMRDIALCDEQDREYKNTR